jgi:uncharacterized membrane protein (DUF106 family)
VFPTLPDWLLPIPYSTLFILLLSVSLSFLTALANRLFTNREQLTAWRKEISRWNADFKKAMKSGDKKLLAKVKRKERYILQLQSKMMWQSMKVSLIFMIPFFIIWQLLIGFYGNTPVAYIPGIDGELAMSLFLWYLLCSFASGILITKALGVSIGAAE